LRNQAPIADVLAQELEADAFVLEIGSGTGQHAAYMTRHLPSIKWQPSELAGRLEGINGWRQRSAQVGFLPPLILDVSQDLWPVKQVDAVFSANVVHFIGWPQLRSMMTGIARVLKRSGLALLYGPFNYAGQYTSEGNQRLDQWLREQNPEAGIKDFEQVILTARKEKLRLLKDIAMPANNRMLVLQKY
jgi:cyclopropane fatty-acyl-phospholipid synthase-like methyltransferase